MAEVNISYSGYFDPDSYVIGEKSYVPLSVTSHKDKDKAVVQFHVYKLATKTAIRRVGTLFKVSARAYLKFSIEGNEYVLDIKDKDITTLEKFKERDIVIKSYVKTKYANLNWLLNQEDSFKYQMLGRLQSDCAYFLGYGAGCEERLWANNVEDHITYMRALHKNLEVKPEWLSINQINDYEKHMKKIKYA